MIWLIKKVTSLPWSDYTLLKNTKAPRNWVQSLPDIFQQKTPNKHAVRSEARNGGGGGL